MRQAWLVLGVVAMAAVALAGCANQRASYGCEMRPFTIESHPEGATVYQVEPVTGHRTAIGQTPLRDQPLMVITSIKTKNAPPDVTARLMAAMGAACVAVEKPGYLPFQGCLRADPMPSRTAEHSIELFGVPGAEPKPDPAL